MYESPININVDKEELIKALEYRREQYIKGYQDGREQEPQWIPISERLPEVNGEYLVTVRGLTGEYVKVEILYYAEDLYKIDEFDFNDKQGVSGWYNYDGEWGYYEVDNVVAWLPLPKPYMAERR